MTVTDAAPGLAASIDDALHAIANQRRRRVIDLLSSEGRPMAIGAVADELVALEAGPAYSNQDRKNVYTGLYVCHCEALDDIGAIEYQARRGMLVPGEELDALADLLADVRGHFDGEEVPA